MKKVQAEILGSEYVKDLCPIFVLMTEEADDRLRPGLEIIDVCGGIISRNVGNAVFPPKSHRAKPRTKKKPPKASHARQVKLVTVPDYRRWPESKSITRRYL